MFLLVHYFGRPAATASARDFCGRHGAWLIEDAAHVLQPVDGVGESGDFVLYSPHKHLPIPDGAVLVVRPNGPGRFGLERLASFGSAATWPGQLRGLVQDMQKAVCNSELRSLAWMCKRVLQKLGFALWRPGLVPFAESLDAGPPAVLRLIAPSRSELARRLLVGALSELGGVARRRQRHQMLWDALLTGNEVSQPDTAVLIGERAVAREWTPYLGVYRVDSAMAQATYHRWQNLGLPVTTWPDLPPEVMAHQEHHARAVRLRHTRLYLPLHQSLSSREIFNKGRLTNSLQARESSLRVVWDAVSSVQWQQWMEQAGRSSLLQSEAYGAAKSADSGWRIKCGAFYHRDEPIAFVQVLQKRLAGVMLVSRINRGPVFLRPPSRQEQREIMALLAGLGCLWRGKVLAIAPELGLSGSNLALMESLAFRQFSPTAWRSIWVDLSMDLATLRKKMDGKWRNMLSFAERSGLRLEIGTDDQSFDWIIERYKTLMNEKAFSGVPIGLLRALRERLPAESQPIIMRAIHDEKVVAGICLVCHGAAATYLLGWNGTEGRKLKANQYLLWQAVVTLKQAGIRWFDLGGIDEDLTPGISAFKLGLGGEQYELVGEYWKW